MLSTETLSPEQALSKHGWFIQRQLLDTEAIAAIRSGLLDEVERLADQRRFNDALLEGGAREHPQQVPLHQRFRKLSQLQHAAVVWNRWLAAPVVLAAIRPFLGDDILNKFASAFLKPARIGGPTPWHQDIGLWRDQNVNAMNGWLAIDGASKDNGCLQVVSGSHRGEIIKHVVYDDSIHGEIPRELCTDLDVEYIELAPGDAVFWHSNLWHYSPPNTSEQPRMGCGAVWINPAQVAECHPGRKFYWAMRDGAAQPHPPQQYAASNNTAADTKTPETY